MCVIMSVLFFFMHTFHCAVFDHAVWTIITRTDLIHQNTFSCLRKHVNVSLWRTQQHVLQMLFSVFWACFNTECLNWSILTRPKGLCFTNELPDLCSLSPSSGPEEWTNNRNKAPPARTSKGVYREQPYSRFWPATVLRVPSQVMDFLWTLFPFLQIKSTKTTKIERGWWVKLCLLNWHGRSPQMEYYGSLDYVV